ncbi:MAG TPA: formimidoylglutamate deiminase, partial [Casimicrobiaceae bacterium]|nr:formimidoylglutamate deiminase [Casimicrobiaceae bacterium]
HAFQRALAGRTGHAARSRDDSFWTWREAMYAFIRGVDADVFGAIAAQAYLEMAKAGYATVGEFHYVHHDPQGKAYADPAELAWRIVAAAEEVGLGLTLLPVFYAHAGFGGATMTDHQRRFAHSVDSYARLIATLNGAASERRFIVGIAPHSLRAVTADELAEVVRLGSADAPVHIHAAEQTKEVDECVAWSGMRPVEWLLKHANVDRRWCVVHATHITDDETRSLARSGATAGLAPTTEADLGDGTFPAKEYVAAAGALGVGSDSNTVIDPFAELRQLEWSQRLRLHRRNVLGSEDLSIGTSLWARAASGGAQALGQGNGAIAVGHRADIVVLNVGDTALVHQEIDDVLDAAIFGPCRQPVRDVMSGGVWIVRDGRHARETEIFARYRAALRSLDH